MTYEEKYDIINNILIESEYLFSRINYHDFIDALIVSDNVTRHLKISATRMRQFTLEVFPNKSRGKLLNYILLSAGYKACRNCDSYLKTSEFRLNKSNADGYNSQCKNCHLIASSKTQAVRQSNYNAAKDNRTPPWADLNKIKEIYNNCPEGYHVDHIHPLRGELISGLHVENNLQYLPAIDNIKKGNRIELS